MSDLEIAPIENLALSSEKPDFSKSVPLTEPTLGRECDDRERRYVGKLQTKTFLALLASCSTSRASPNRHSNTSDLSPISR